MINKDNISIFHLAIPTHDLKIAESFYYASLEFPIGRIEKDDDGNENKLDNDVYIISVLIDIPEFKIYE